jgi:hypothetical protein
MKYDGTRGVQHHILDKADKVAKLNALRMHVNDSFLFQFILNSLPSQFDPFKINYNTNN